MDSCTKLKYYSFFICALFITINSFIYYIYTLVCDGKQNALAFFASIVNMYITHNIYKRTKNVVATIIAMENAERTDNVEIITDEN